MDPVGNNWKQRAEAAEAELLQTRIRLRESNDSYRLTRGDLERAEAEVARLRELNAQNAEVHVRITDQLRASVAKLERDLRLYSSTRLENANGRIAACKDHLAEALYHRDNDPAHEMKKALEILRGESDLAPGAPNGG